MYKFLSKCTYKLYLLIICDALIKTAGNHIPKNEI